MLCHHLRESPLKLLIISRGCLAGRPSLKIKKQKDTRRITKQFLDALDPIKALCHHLREICLKSLTTSKQEEYGVFRGCPSGQRSLKRKKERGYED